MFKLCCRKLHIQMEEDSEVSAKTEIARREVKRAACMIGGTHVLRCTIALKERNPCSDDLSVALCAVEGS